VRYTNKELYKKLEDINKNIVELKIAQAVINDKVKLHDKVLYSFGSILIIVMGWLIATS